MNNYFESKDFHHHREHINGILSKLPFQESPNGWHKKFDAAVGGLIYLGFSENCDCLLTVSSSGRGLWDLSTGERIARIHEPEGTGLNERKLLCQGIDLIEDENVRVAGVGGGGLITGTHKGERLTLTSPLYPCYDVVFQPNYRSCFAEGKNQDCVIVFRGFVKIYGFSYSGDYFVIADEDIQVWERTD